MFYKVFYASKENHRTPDILWVWIKELLSASLRPSAFVSSSLVIYQKFNLWLKGLPLEKWPLFFIADFKKNGSYIKPKTCIFVNEITKSWANMHLKRGFIFIAIVVSNLKNSWNSLFRGVLSFHYSHIILITMITFRKNYFRTRKETTPKPQDATRKRFISHKIIIVTLFKIYLSIYLSIYQSNCFR